MSSDLVPKPLTAEELTQIEADLADTVYVKPEDGRYLGQVLEYSALEHARSAEEKATLAALAAWLICEHRLYDYLADELGNPFVHQKDYLRYLQRRNIMARSTFYKHQSTIRLWKGLGRKPTELLGFGAGVRDAHHLKAVVLYDQKSGQVLAPRAGCDLPEDDLVTALNTIIDDIKAGGSEYALTPQGISKTIRGALGGEPQISFYFAQGPFGHLALAWYYAPEEGGPTYRGIVGLDEMPQTVAAKLRDRVRATERDPEPFSKDAGCPKCGSILKKLEWKDG